MARAKKCDRCGAYYEKNTKFSKKLNFNNNAIDGMCFTTDHDSTIDFRDLCDNCISKLYLFLDGKDLKED